MKILSGILILVSAVLARAAEPGVYTTELGSGTFRLEEVYYDDFSEGLSTWRVEGDAAVKVEDGWLHVDATSGEVGAATIWCTREFHGAQLVEYDVRLRENSVQSNVNMFLLASKLEGGGILETSGVRTGRYGEYHRFPNYLITLLNTASPARRQMLRVRMRLNPGFELVDEAWHEPFVFGRVYHVAYLVQPPAVTVFLDGRKLCSTAYDTVLKSGLHGLRIWHTSSMYDNFRVSRLVE